ncbi:hypothetical protein B6D60_07130 [candidate division KSB1 bacterium 4484_87]|nr:MAG: hypothetical protein B6D60_07130 [candidate division KSB1 bacterium 4484_87]
MTLIIILSVILLLLGLWEKNQLRNAQTNDILRVQVNGIRGKSTLVRMVTDLLTADGKKVCARVSGEAPQIFDEENGWRIFPRKGAARIKEISRFLLNAAARKPDVVICENMALQPEYQRSFSEIFCPQISAYTNLRIDHQEVMGRNKPQIAETLFFSLPEAGTVIFPKDENFQKEFERRAKITLNSNILPEPGSGGDNPFQFHFQLLGELRTQLGIDQQTIEKTKERWEEKLATNNFIRHFSIGGKKIHFINLFTCNDVESTKQLLDYAMMDTKTHKKIAVILACRSDRPLRTLSFLDWLVGENFWQKLVIYGSVPFFAVRKKLKQVAPSQQVVFARGKNMDKILLELAAENGIMIGMGNYLKSGERLIQMFQEMDNGN